MSRKRGPYEVKEGILTHPAVVALKRARPDFGPVERVEVLKERGSSRGVFRLSFGAGSGGAVIAKQGEADTIRTERHVYETVLPSLGVPSLQLLGATAGRPGSLWIFTQTAEGTRFDEGDPGHRGLAAAWIARLHAHEWPAASRSGMPLRDMTEYREVLDRALDTLRAVRSTNALLPPEGASTIERLEAQLRALQTDWSSFVEEGELAPHTVVHGDVQAKNMVVSPEGRLLVFDWEHCGVGDPCRDLDACIDLDVYFGAVTRRWPWLTREGLRRMAVRGEVLRLIDAIGWDSVRLDSPWWERSLRHMEGYARDLRQLDLESILGTIGVTR